MTIKEKVAKSEGLLKAMNSVKELRTWAIANGMDNRAAFPKFKDALLEIGINYEKIRSDSRETKAEELSSKINYQVTLYSDAKASADRYAITDEDGGVLWYGRFFDNDNDYNGEQSSGELSAAKKAVWLASKIKEAIGAEAIRLNLLVDAQWLTYQDHYGQKGYALTLLANKYGIQLNVEWIPGTQNPADKWTIASGFKKWSDNDLRILAKPIQKEKEPEEETKEQITEQIPLSVLQTRLKIITAKAEAEPENVLWITRKKIVSGMIENYDKNPTMMALGGKVPNKKLEALKAETKALEQSLIELKVEREKFVTETNEKFNAELKRKAEIEGTITHLQKKQLEIGYSGMQGLFLTKEELENENLIKTTPHCFISAPKELIEIYAKDKVLNKSPYSCSSYSCKKDWGHTQNGCITITDHFNFYSQGNWHKATTIPTQEAVMQAEIYQKSHNDALESPADPDTPFEQSNYWYVAKFDESAIPYLAKLLQGEGRHEGLAENGGWIIQKVFKKDKAKWDNYHKIDEEIAKWQVEWGSLKTIPGTYKIDQSIKDTEEIIERNQRLIALGYSSWEKYKSDATKKLKTEWNRLYYSVAAKIRDGRITASLTKRDYSGSPGHFKLTGETTYTGKISSLTRNTVTIMATNGSYYTGRDFTLSHEGLSDGEKQMLLDTLLLKDANFPEIQYSKTFAIKDINKIDFSGDLSTEIVPEIEIKNDSQEDNPGQSHETADNAIAKMADGGQIDIAGEGYIIPIDPAEIEKKIEQYKQEAEAAYAQNKNIKEGTEIGVRDIYWGVKINEVGGKHELKSEFAHNTYEKFPKHCAYRDVITKIDKANYYIATTATFINVDTGEKSTSDFWSELCASNKCKESPKSDSQYYITDTGVYRYANHWGHVASCYWNILPFESEGYQIGFAKWEDFTVTGSGYPYFTYCPDYYIGRVENTLIDISNTILFLQKIRAKKSLRERWKAQITQSIEELYKIISDYRQFLSENSTNIKLANGGSVNGIHFISKRQNGWYSSGQGYFDMIKKEGYEDADKVIPTVTENDFHIATKGRFQPSSEIEFNSIDTPIFRSDSGSLYKVKDNILYRASNHWGKVGSCDWASPADVERFIFAKIPLSDLKRTDKAIVKMTTGGAIGDAKRHSPIGFIKDSAVLANMPNHDMIANCGGCGFDFSYQSGSTNNTRWQCPNCNLAAPLNTNVMSDGGKIKFIKEVRAAKDFGKVIGIPINEKGSSILDGLDRYVYEMMQDLAASIKEYADTDEDIADFTIDSFALSEDSVKDRKKFGQTVQSCLAKYFDL